MPTKPKRRLLSFFPHVITLTGLFFGFSSILCSVQAINDLYWGFYYQREFFEPHPERFLALASTFIFLSGILDFFDGYSARLLKSDSLIGAELDSLTDFVSFGIAPGVLFYTTTLIAGGHVPNAGLEYKVNGAFSYFFLDRLYLLKPLAFLFPICTVIRLARFKLGGSKLYFKGMPSTYAGALIAVVLTFNFYLTPVGKVIAMYEKNIPEWLLVFARFYDSVFSNYFFVLFFYIFFSILMVSNFRFYRIDFLIRYFNIKVISPYLLVLLVISALFLKYFFVLFNIFYLVFTFFNNLYEWLTKSHLDEKAEAD